MRGLNLLLSVQRGTSEKLGAYECGFDPFEDSRSSIEISFYLVGMMFLLFDREGVLRFPWPVCLENGSRSAARGVRDFILELILGYIYLWMVGGLEY